MQLNRTYLPTRKTISNFLLGILLSVHAIMPAKSQAESLPINPKVKAAFVYNLLKFVEWPLQSGVNAVTVCLVNPDAGIEPAFAAINGRVANGRSVTVRVVADNANFSLCNVIYLNDGAVKKVLNQIAATRKDALTISDASNFIGDGGAVAMLLGDDGRLQFEVNLEITSRAPYVLSAQLLKLARNTQ